MSRFLNKVAVVTGGARGIGKAIVAAFVAEGACVVVGDIDVRAADLELQFGAEQVAFKHTDVTVDSDIEALVAYAVDRFGHLDIMVNNAGALGDQAALVDLESNSFSKTVALLLGSVALGHTYAARQMITQGGGGSIVSISSIAGIQAGWSSASYDAAKAAVLHFARSASYELAAKQIRSNVVAPGLILTPIIGTACNVTPEHYEAFTESLREPYGNLIPLGRAGTPEDIAQAVLFFASDGASHITGQALAVDGGLTSMTGFDIGALVAQAVEAFNTQIDRPGDGKIGWLPNRNG